MYAFVFNWTPALDSKEVPPPHGVIFAMFMMACMCGASCSTLLGNGMSPMLRLKAAFVAGIISFAVAASVGGNSTGSLMLSFAAFLLFEFCVGLYFPSVGVVKSDLVPESVRSTMYNFYRVPLNAIVVSLLLGSISLATCFKLCALLLLAALLCITSIVNMKPSEQAKSL